ncbi:BON domain-containing protein [Blastopirellula marina]|uniref:Transport-associated protein n=1 Tax=Blastopirellula marina TaxID=124 RepID=A0A2S8F2C3_9BACT|nr:BON domain-containing protein [Blastopirellula marina]PQO26290.1 transport-associated protein [Blastopirellula marina]PQO47170.1 transport-associated protein [Blastopirellula marina]PTL40690.1 BON domain-containing protein [Blastopirellula marina]
MNQTDFAANVERALANNPHFAGRTLRFEQEQDRIVLKGSVASFFHKQMAQEALRQAGVDHIENQLEVTWA